jgi:organic radical activating enzyme
MKFLRERVGFLSAVVFSGGEPLAQCFLRQAVEEVKSSQYAR